MVATPESPHEGHKIESHEGKKLEARGPKKEDPCALTSLDKENVRGKGGGASPWRACHCASVCVSVCPPVPRLGSSGLCLSGVCPVRCLAACCFLLPCGRRPEKRQRHFRYPRSLTPPLLLVIGLLLTADADIERRVRYCRLYHLLLHLSIHMLSCAVAVGANDLSDAVKVSAVPVPECLCGPSVLRVTWSVMNAGPFSHPARPWRSIPGSCTVVSILLIRG